MFKYMRHNVPVIVLNTHHNGGLHTGWLGSHPEARFVLAQVLFTALGTLGCRRCTHAMSNVYTACTISRGNNCLQTLIVLL